MMKNVAPKFQIKGISFRKSADLESVSTTLQKNNQEKKEKDLKGTRLETLHEMIRSPMK
jgi:hypothetical protein